jgi:hypothetical protein
LLSRFKLQGLHSLKLLSASWLGSEGVVSLQRATRLTCLSLCVRGALHVEPSELGLALSRMSKLQALSLGGQPLPATACFEAIGRLTGLTSLSWWAQATNADVAACLGLSELCVLKILRGAPSRPAPLHDHITRETLFALAKLPELTNLEVTERFVGHPIALELGIYALLGRERHKKGWLRFKLNFRW